MDKRAQIINKLKEALDGERFAHSLRVERSAVALARKHGVSVKKASLAALLHDCARKFKREQLIREAVKAGIKVDALSRFEPKLLHAELGARMAGKEFGIKDKEVLSAIRKHTVGSPAMTRLEKILYLADHIEEGRDFRGVKKIRRTAFQDMDRAVAESATKMLKYLLDQGLPAHPGTVYTRNYYLTNKK